MKGIVRQSRVLAVSVVVILALSYIASGLYIVGPDEAGLVQRFGELLRSDVLPGLHYRLPWPVDRVAKLRVDRISRVEIGFRSKKDGGVLLLQRPFVHEWNIEHKYGR